MMMRKGFIKAVLILMMIGFAQATTIPSSAKKRVEESEKAYSTKEQSDRIIVKGDGFVITERDIKAFLNKFSVFPGLKKKNLVVKKLVKIKLFALEAEKLGLVPKGEKNILKAARAYEMHLLKTTKVPEEAIESYYIANYRVYETENGTLPPLTEDKKEEIRRALIARARVKIIEKEAERLMKKYHVVFIGERG